MPKSTRAKVQAASIPCHHDSLPQSAPLNALATHDNLQALFSSLDFLQPCDQFGRPKYRQCTCTNLQANYTV